MSDAESNAPLPDKIPEQVIGEVVWRDLTVADAPGLRDFYREVVGWSVSELEMPAPAEGEEPYSDFVMQAGKAGSDEVDAVAGVVHARGTNAGLPPVWLMYVRVAEITASIAAAEARGGKCVHGPRSMGGGVFAVVRDPAGAQLGLWEDSGAFAAS